MLITLEGIDGSGKTTAWEALSPSYPDAVFTREPTNSWYGDAVRRSVGINDADPLAELFLYTADHAAHLASIVRPALSDGSLVISDRYSDSRFAYQGATLSGIFDHPMEFVREIHQPWSRPPDWTIYLDVDPVEAVARSGSTDKFERIDTLERIRDNYERLVEAEPDRFVRVDANVSKDVVTRRVGEVVQHILNE